VSGDIFFLTATENSQVFFVCEWLGGNSRAISSRFSYFQELSRKEKRQTTVEYTLLENYTETFPKSVQ
jgi:hypothetical protein